MSAACAAPSARDSKPWRFTVLSSPAARHALVAALASPIPNPSTPQTHEKPAAAERVTRDEVLRARRDKRSWNLQISTAAGSQLITTLKELRSVGYSNDAIRIMLKLPVAESMPATLISDLEEAGFIAPKKPKVSKRRPDEGAGEPVFGDDLGVRLSASDAMLGTAPVLIVPWLSFAKASRFPKAQRARAEKDTILMSAGAAIQSLLLALHAQGLASCWTATAIFRQDQTRAALSMPKAWFPLGVVAVGRMPEGGASGPRPPVDLDTFLIWQ